MLLNVVRRPLAAVGARSSFTSPFHMLWPRGRVVTGGSNSLLGTIPERSFSEGDGDMWSFNWEMVSTRPLRRTGCLVPQIVLTSCRDMEPLRVDFLSQQQGGADNPDCQ